MNKKISKTGVKKTVANGITDSFLQNESFLKRFVARFLSRTEDVEDVVQETYLRAYVAGQSTDIVKPKSFLFTTAKNIALTKLTKKSKRVTDFLEEYSQRDDLNIDPTPADIVDAQQQLEIYCAAVKKLNGKCREAFLLKKVHGMTHNEIALQMSLSLSSVEKYLHRAMIECDQYIVKSNEGGLKHQAPSKAVSRGQKEAKK